MIKDGDIQILVELLEGADTLVRRGRVGDSVPVAEEATRDVAKQAGRVAVLAQELAVVVVLFGRALAERA